MQFLSPWMAWFGLTILVLVLLYLLKQRYKEQQIPSTWLWHQVTTQWEAVHPWQKWRNRLLLFLQLLVLILLILSLMNPVLRVKGMGQNNIVVLDASLSMQANENGQTRFDVAKESILQIVDQMRDDEQMSLILSGNENQVIQLRESDRAQLKNMIAQFQPQNGTNELEKAVLLAQSLQKEDQPETIYVFTDQILPTQLEDIHVQNVARGSGNFAVRRVSYAPMDEESIRILSVIQSFSNEKTTRTVSLLVDGELLDIQELTINANEMVNAIFDRVPIDARYAEVVIDEEDALMSDNHRFLALQNNQKYRVLLETTRNLFLEKAILLRQDIELYKVAENEGVDRAEYDLLISDRGSWETIPDNQAVWMIHPQNNTNRFTLKPLEEGSFLPQRNSIADNLFQYINWSRVQLATGNAIITEGQPMTSLLTYGDQTVIMADDVNGAKLLVIGFGFHDTNLPVMKEFPILTQNILAWFLPEQTMQVSNLGPGETIPLVLRGNTQKIEIQLPDKTKLDDWSNVRFDQTDQLGIYEIDQFDADGVSLAESFIAVNAPVEYESDLRLGQSNGAGSVDSVINNVWRQRELFQWLLLAALIIMLIEWWVYYREIRISK